jgi:hypothetical protein
VWHLSAAGERILRLAEGTPKPHRRYFEPSMHFLTHMLAVSQCYVRLVEIGRSSKIGLLKADTEPSSWRPYNRTGKIVTLKPDLFAITVCGVYEDHWFIEVDLATEAPIRIIEKCEQYYQYYRTDMEQKQYGVFPLVVWIVPDEKRKESLRRHLREHFTKGQNLFVVITLAELEPLIRQEIDWKGEKANE